MPPSTAAPLALAPGAAPLPATRRAGGRAPARLLIGRLLLALHGAGGAPPALREVADLRLESIGGAVRELLLSDAGGPLDVHLASGCCRMLLLPWNRQLTSAERWHNLARARFEEKFGAASEEWDLRLAHDLPGRDRLAVAWPASLRDALAATPHVRSVRIDLLEQLTGLLAREPGRSGCIAEIEADGAQLLLLLGGRVRRIRSCRFEQAAELVSVLRAEWAALEPTDGMTGGAKESVGDAASGAVTRAAAGAPAGALALAVSTPFAQRDGARAGAFAALAAELGFRQGAPLPAWA